MDVQSCRRFRPVYRGIRFSAFRDSEVRLYFSLSKDFANGSVLVLVLADLTCGFGDSVGYINSPINLMASIVIAMNMSIFPPSVV